MRSEYKRDVHHNYLVLEGDRRVEETSYPVRMLLANALPLFLKCRLQGMDGKMLFYYEITSRQSVETFYEKKKFSYEDLKLIFGSVIQLIEKMAEYLLSPDQLVLEPEFIFLDIERRQLSFCYLPGYEKTIREQFQTLTEYILPKLDHEDSRAVMLGYGIYRRALEDVFQLEHMKAEVFQSGQEENVQEEETVEKYSAPTWTETGKEEKEKSEELFAQVEKEKVPEKAEKKRGVKNFLLLVGECLLVTTFSMLFILAELMGYIPRIGVEATIGILILVAVGIALAGRLFPKKEEEKEIVVMPKFPEPVEEKNISDPLEVKSGKKLQYDLEERSEKRKKDPDAFFRNNSFRGWESGNQPGDYGETVILSAEPVKGPATFVSREPGELATIYLQEELTVIGKMENAADAVITLPTISRLHAKVRKRGEEYYLSDLNSRNGTAVNGRMLKADEEYLLQDEDQVDFAEARYIFLK